MLSLRMFFFPFPHPSLPAVGKVGLANEVYLVLVGVEQRVRTGRKSCAQRMSG